MPVDQDGPDVARRARRGNLETFLACAALALCSALVAVLAWTSPTRTNAVVRYQQSGQFNYSAAAIPTSIYGSGGLTTGQPIYLSTVSAVHFSYSYLFSARGSNNLSGREQLVATISNGQGLTRTIPLQPSTAFKGAKFTANGTLAMATVQSIAGQFDQAAGGVSQGTYTVSMSPSVTINGRVGTAHLNTAFDTPSQFTYSAGILVPSGSSASQATGQTAVPPVTSTGSVTEPGGQAAKWLLGLPVGDVRVAALVVLLACLFVGWRVGSPLLTQATSDDEDDRILARYGSSLVEVNALPTRPGLTTVDLSSFDGLVQVGRRLECPMLHRAGQTGVYAVIDNNTLYRYTKAPASNNTPIPEAISLERDERSCAATSKTISV
jgi:hypothetical protein